ncbi:hypothetical protein [Deinococcus depolymerans]|uniref:Uncharacterized protein n=1 Tax=Deinococcus depolymerans TaxID=392408 RepID=A0ABP3MJM4_9DEIO
MHTPSPTHTPDHPQAQLTHTTHLQVTDDETFGRDHALGCQHDLTLLGPACPDAAYHLRGLGGRDRQVTLSVTFTLTPAGPVQISGEARLLARPPDLPARELGCAAFSGQVAPGETRTLRTRLCCHESGDEYARITLTVQHTALHPADPAGTLHACAQALGAAHTGPPAGPCEAVRGGHRRSYRHADLYASPATGVHEIRGDLRRRYDALGGPDSLLGLPVSDPTPTADRAGQFSHFQGGSLFLHPRTGPMAVHGDLRAAWASAGWERGPLGYPTSDTLPLAPDGSFNDFQNGVLVLLAGRPTPPVTATLTRGALLAAVDAALRRHLPAGLLDSVTLAGVSDTRFDLRRSGNRVLTFHLRGPVRPGPHGRPDPAFEAWLPVQFAASPAPDACRPVRLIARQAGLITLRAPPDRQGRLPSLGDALGRLLRAPVTLASVPGHAGLLSFKVLADGSLSLSFRPDPAGHAAAAAARRFMDRLRPTPRPASSPGPGAGDPWRLAAGAEGGAPAARR